jgi:hypothetical protein
VRRVASAVAALAAAALAVGSASATPTRDTLIRPGQGIGKVDLGMTIAQVRAALGRPGAVVRRQEIAFGGEYVELQWAQGAWTVGFRTRANRLRAVRVATQNTTQRTRHGLGMGSRPRRIVAVYPHATCVTRELDKPFPGTWIVVTHASGRMTAFAIDNVWHSFQPPTHKVNEVLVQERWFNRPEEIGCGPDWRRW